MYAKKFSSDQCQLRIPCDVQIPSFKYKPKSSDFVFSSEWQNLIGPFPMKARRETDIHPTTERGSNDLDPTMNRKKMDWYNWRKVWAYWNIDILDLSVSFPWNNLWFETISWQISSFGTSGRRCSGSTVNDDSGPLFYPFFPIFFQLFITTFF